MRQQTINTIKNNKQSIQWLLSRIKNNDCYSRRYCKLVKVVIKKFNAFLKCDNYYKYLYKFNNIITLKGTKELLIICFFHYLISYYHQTKCKNFDLLPFKWLAIVFGCDRTLISKTLKKFNYLFQVIKFNRFNKRLTFNPKYVQMNKQLNLVFNDLNLYVFKTVLYKKFREKFNMSKSVGMEVLDQFIKEQLIQNLTKTFL